MKKFLKYLYEIVPFKNKIFFVVKSIIPIPESIYKHLHFKGVFTLKVDKALKFKMHHIGVAEENELFWGGLENGWEKTSLNLWMKLCRFNTNILDIGANTGIYSLVAKCVNPYSNVVAFECLPGVLQHLSNNIKLNDYNIKIIPYALSNYDGKAKIFITKGMSYDNSVCVNKSLLPSEVETDEIEITTITLKSYIEKEKITNIDLVKVDVETHEPEVIEGLSLYLDEFTPDFLMEVWDEECAIKLNHLFKNKGYLYFDINDKNNIITQKEEITVSTYWNYLICKPNTARKIGLI